MIHQPTPKTPLEAIIKAYEEKPELQFRPSMDFYDRIGINRIRFWQLVKGKKKDLLASELHALAEFFNVSPNQILSNEKPGN